MIKGLVERVSSSFINLVNADYTAKQRGLRISEETVSAGSQSEGPVSYIRVEVLKTPSKFASAKGSDGKISVSGKVQVTFLSFRPSWEKKNSTIQARTISVFLRIATLLLSTHERYVLSLDFRFEIVLLDAGRIPFPLLRGAL